MKHKISSLEGALLDAAVAKAETGDSQVPGTFRPSTEWNDGGPIIERERISIVHGGMGDWHAFMGDPQEGVAGDGEGLSPLIAAMRAYVASKFGDKVELP